MSGDAIDRVTERLRLAREARKGELSAGPSPAVPAASQGRDALVVGARVFDVLRGQEGEIVRPPAGAPVSTASVYVRFDQGVVCARPPKDLLVRPTPPAARG